MTSKINERVKVQLKVFKPLDCYPGMENDYFVAVVGPGIQLGNNDTKTAPRCNPVGRYDWGKDLWLPKNSTLEYKFLVVRACTGVVTDIETINPHKIYVGHKSIIIEHTYNKPAFTGREAEKEYKQNISEKGRNGNFHSNRRNIQRCHEPVQSAMRSTSYIQPQYNGSSQRCRRTTKQPKDDSLLSCKKANKLKNYNKASPSSKTFERIAFQKDDTKQLADDELIVDKNTKDIVIENGHHQTDKYKRSKRETEVKEIYEEMISITKTHKRMQTERTETHAKDIQNILATTSDMNRRLQIETYKAEDCEEIMPLQKISDGVLSKKEVTQTEVKQDITANNTDIKVPSKIETDMAEVSEDIICLPKTPEIVHNKVITSHEEVEHGMKAITTGMEIPSQKETDMKEVFDEIAESILSKNDETKPDVDTEMNMTGSTTDMKMGFQKDTGMINVCEETTFESKPSECILSKNDFTKQKMITNTGANDNKPEVIEIEAGQTQNNASAVLDITDARIEMKTLDVENEIDVQNGTNSVKLDIYGHLFNINGKKVAVAAAGVAVLSCIGYFVFYRK